MERALKDGAIVMDLLVLGVDDDQRRVLRRRGGAWLADQFAEGLDLGCRCHSFRLFVSIESREPDRWSESLDAQISGLDVYVFVEFCGNALQNWEEWRQEQVDDNGIDMK